MTDEIQWKFVKRKLDELKPQNKNPRKMSKNQRENLCKSLRENGDACVLTINADGTILGGHQRYAIFKSKGVEWVDCKEAERNLTQKEIDRITIMLNKAEGRFDSESLANGYSAEDLIDWGFTMDELHLESIPDQTTPPKSFQITAKFENEDDLRQAETHIAAIIDQYASASYKVKVK